MKKAKGNKLLKKAIKGVAKEEVKEEPPEEPINVETIFGEKISPFSIFEVSNELREQCKTIMDPVVKQQAQISGLLKTMNTAFINMKKDVETNSNNIQDMKGEMKQQQTFNKQLKIANSQKQSELEKFGRYLTTNTEKISGITESLK